MAERLRYLPSRHEYFSAPLSDAADTSVQNAQNAC